MMPRTQPFMPALALTVTLAGLLGASSASLAQSNPLTLPPPGYTSPADGRQATSPDTAKARTAKKPARRAVKDAESATPTAKRTRRDDPDFAPAQTEQAKSRRFVPEEFDDDGSGSSPRPFVSPSGRAGVGMRF